MGQVILGRVISGAGSSGMAGLVSILITGEAPQQNKHEFKPNKPRRSSPHPGRGPMACLCQPGRHLWPQRRRSPRRLARRCHRLALVSLSNSDGIPSVVRLTRIQVLLRPSPAHRPRHPASHHLPPRRPRPVGIRRRRQQRDQPEEQARPHRLQGLHPVRPGGSDPAPAY